MTLTPDRITLLQQAGKSFLTNVKQVDSPRAPSKQQRLLVVFQCACNASGEERLLRSSILSHGGRMDPRLKGYGFAVATVVVAWGVREALVSLWGRSDVPFLVFHLAVVVAAVVWPGWAGSAGDCS